MESKELLFLYSSVGNTFWGQLELESGFAGRVQSREKKKQTGYCWSNLLGSEKTAGRSKGRE